MNASIFIMRGPEGSARDPSSYALVILPSITDDYKKILFKKKKK